ncbi:uncharacterized protein LOC130962778 [Arachis stenosperma]|uniref:uncharacterized protein LOC130962778 n=1 Tax=Arachis stenosperma TaxID=217475 RepID=UPI0025AB6E84|nr:uncharacterized protein LOC130962778 [Arachis stenosperma]
MKRFLYTQHVPEVQSVEIVTYMLKGVAQKLWPELCYTLQIELIDIPWNRFKMEFYEKYFLHALRTAKKLELMQLKQKNMSVADYTREFNNMCRLSRVCQGNPADYEEWKCAQYEKGLRRDIFNYVYLQRKTMGTAPDEPHRTGLDECYKCGKPGHTAQDCPHRKHRNVTETDFQTRALMPQPSAKTKEKKRRKGKKRRGGKKEKKGEAEIEKRENEGEKRAEDGEGGEKVAAVQLAPPSSHTTTASWPPPHLVVVIRATTAVC